VKTKLVYVLPVYDAESAEHTYPMHGFLQRAAEFLDLLVIIERTQGSLGLSDLAQDTNLAIYQRRLQVPILKSLEMLAVMVWAHINGYRTYYTHYSMSAGILSALVTRILGGVSYYWSCGQMMLFVPRHVRSLHELRAKFRNQWLLGLTLRSVHHLVTCNPTMARYYGKHYCIEPQTVFVMPNWVDLARFSNLPDKASLRAELGWPLDQKVVLFLHRLSQRKGAHHVVPVAQELLRMDSQLGSRCLFVVVGGGPYRSQLEHAIHTAGLQEQFRVLGWVPNREVPKYFAAADVYMMPSVEEAFGRTLLEAMASGCAIAAMDVGGVRDVLSPAQQRFLVPEADSQAMATALNTLLTDDALRHELSVEGRRRVQDYSEDKTVRTFVSILGEERVETGLHGKV